FYVSPVDSSVSLIRTERNSIEVFPLLSDGEDGRWRWGKETSAERINELCARTVGADKRYDIFQIDYADGINGEKRVKPKTVWSGKGFANESGSLELKSLFGKKFFDTPKPIGLIKYCLEHATQENDLVLDFFAGSSTTAHAVMQLNAECGGSRRFIMVQLPEPCDEKSDAFKAGYESIAEISKERIRRAGQNILEGDCHPDWNRDVGFRVLKVDTSNMKDVYYRPDQLSQADLFESVDNVKPDRSAEDLLFQVLVDWGVDLSLPIRRETLHGKTVFFVDDNALVACFDQGISEELVKELAKAEPLRVVFRDNGFASDALKINVEQIFRQLSPSTELKTL
ncbi:DNA methyltransferase, partial [Stutzerimonas balearica]|uniref:DNA methyltransferase n=1 Tax=Stutzerimonas balearica TaxID=74829 RepID=UPI0022B072F3